MHSTSLHHEFFNSRFMHRGRFVGHNGAVCALVVKGTIMATGARDRLIKVNYFISCVHD